MEVKVRQIAELIKAEIEGDGEAVVTHPGKIESAEEGAITFFSNPKYEKYLYDTKATAVIVDKKTFFTRPVPATLLRVSNVYLALSKLFHYYENIRPRPVGISEKASVSPSAQVGTDVYIGDFAVIMAGAKIGLGSHIAAQVYIGENVRIGRDVKIYPGVRIYEDCHIGDRVVIHANTVVGSDGFGFAHDEEGNYIKIPQIGNVEIGDDVEIGANTVIDRASMGATVIKNGVKLDNLIQIGHNVVIGKDTVIAAQTGISGSAKIGNNNVIAGQVGIVGHIETGDDCQIGGKSGVSSNLKNGSRFFGSPAMEIRAFQKSYAVFRQLPELRKMVLELRKILKDKEDPE